MSFLGGFLEPETGSWPPPDRLGRLLPWGLAGAPGCPASEVLDGWSRRRAPARASPGAAGSCGGKTQAAQEAPSASFQVAPVAPRGAVPRKDPWDVGEGRWEAESWSPVTGTQTRRAHPQPQARRPVSPLQDVAWLRHVDLPACAGTWGQEQNPGFGCGWSSLKLSLTCRHHVPLSSSRGRLP